MTHVPQGTDYHGVIRLSNEVASGLDLRSLESTEKDQFNMVNIIPIHEIVRVQLLRRTSRHLVL